MLRQRAIAVLEGALKYEPHFPFRRAGRPHGIGDEDMISQWETAHPARVAPGSNRTDGRCHPADDRSSAMRSNRCQRCYVRLQKIRNTNVSARSEEEPPIRIDSAPRMLVVGGGSRQKGCRLPPAFFEVQTIAPFMRNAPRTGKQLYVEVSWYRSGLGL